MAWYKFDRVAVFAVLLCSVAATPVLAQSSAVTGHITDSSGSPIQGAKVDIVSGDTSGAHSVETNGEGFFLFPPLLPGSYVLHAIAGGFGGVTVGADAKRIGAVDLHQIGGLVEDSRERFVVHVEIRLNKFPREDKSAS